MTPDEPGERVDALIEARKAADFWFRERESLRARVAALETEVKGWEQWAREIDSAIVAAADESPKTDNPTAEGFSLGFAVAKEAVRRSVHRVWAEQDWQTDDNCHCTCHAVGDCGSCGCELAADAVDSLGKSAASPSSSVPVLPGVQRSEQ